MIADLVQSIRKHRFYSTIPGLASVPYDIRLGLSVPRSRAKQTPNKKQLKPPNFGDTLQRWTIG